MTYCVECGNWLGPFIERIDTKSTLERIAERAPFIRKMRESEVGYPLVCLGAVMLLMVLSIASARLEGLASVILLAIGLIAFKAFRGTPGASAKILAEGSMMGVLIFAFAGVCFDQAGNAVYNKPLELVLCPGDAHVQRTAVALNPLPDSTYVIQDFACYGKDGREIKAISLPAVIVVRFIEYAALGCFLLCLRWLISRIRSAARR